MIGLGQGIVSSAALGRREIGPQKVLLDAKIDASLITSDFPLLTGSLHEWKDQIPGQPSTIQTIAIAKPTVGTAFGEQGVSIDGTNQYMVIPFTHDWDNEEFTIIAVASKLTSSGVRGLIGNRFGAGASNWWTMGMTGFPKTVIERNGGVITLDFGFDMRGLDLQILEFNHRPGVNERIFRNGSLSDTESHTLNLGGLTNELRIGAWFLDANPNKWTGFIHQIEVWTNTWTPEFRATRIAELATKWQTV